MTDSRVHTPVLLKEAVEMLSVKEDGIYLDATAGLGGHAAEILSRLGAEGRLIGIDRDENALAYARTNLSDNRVHLCKGSFSELKDILFALNINEIDGALFDLGVSMLQIKDYERGFSFLAETKLDMRMDKSQELTAWDIVNKYPEREIARILSEFGEEPLARKIARSILLHRTKASVNTCSELADIVMRVYRRRGKTHPATRTFQALRIEVNKEMNELKKGLESAVDVLKKNGRLCVISYHSLEDRIVKNFIRTFSNSGILKAITKKPLLPDRDETRRNPASRSAKLRGAEKI